MKHFDLISLIAISLILIIGLTTIKSVAPDLFPYQIMFVFLGLLIFVFFSRLDYEIVNSLLIPLYILTVFFLVSPFLFGIISRGAQRWIQIGPIFLQPSEVIKPILILTFSSMVNKFSRPLDLPQILICLLLYLPLGTLVLIQPDLGSTVVISTGVIGCILAGGIRIKHLIYGITAMLIFAPLLFFVMHDYQRNRLLTFINPYRDPLGKGYNSIQSIIAVGSGQLLGRGLGRGTQSHLRFLPENHTDFIFASIAEELGFVGSVILLSAYFVLHLRIYKISLLSGNRLGVILGLGILSLLGLQTLLNLAMNIGLAPITGVTLPLVSYGGSSLISTFALLGIVQSIYSSSKPIPSAITIN